MPHHKSAIKRVKTNKTRNVRNRYEMKTLRTTVRKVRQATEHDQATEALENAISSLDRASRKGYIHKNKAARNKSRLIKYVRTLESS